MQIEAKPSMDYHLTVTKEELQVIRNAMQTHVHYLYGDDGESPTSRVRSLLAEIEEALK